MADGAPEILTWVDDAGEAHVVDVDVVTGHEDDRQAEVTSHPVEKGADISDHVIQAPDKLTIEIAQTQTPFPSAIAPGIHYAKPKGFSSKTVTLDVRKSLFKAGGLLALTQAVQGAIGAGLSAIGLGGPAQSDETKVRVFTADNPTDRIGELHDQLIDIKQKSYFCTVTFRGRVYPNYIMTGVKWATQKGEAGLGRFTCTLVSVRIVENAVAELPDPASLRLKPKEDQAKPPKKMSASEEATHRAQLESAASRLTGGAGVSSS